MQTSYGIVWRDGDRPVAAGKLELLPRKLRLDGRSATREIRYDDLTGIRVGRSPAERLDGRPSIVLDRRSGDPVTISTVAQASVIGELADRIATLQAGAQLRERLVIVLPLKPHAVETAKALLRSGPPFDPTQLPGLERHDVLLTGHEAIFLFESSSSLDGLTEVFMDPAVWSAASAWREYLDGPPRVAVDAYSWTREQGEPDNVYYLPTPGPGDSEGGNIF